MNEIEELKKRIALLEEINSKKEIDEKTDLLAKDMNTLQKGVLIFSFVSFIIIFLILMYGLIKNSDPVNHSIAGLLSTAWLTGCFIILDFCPFGSKKKRNYTVFLRFITAAFILLGILSLK